MGAVLYSFRRCPYAMRGRMALDVSGVDYEHREIILKDKPQSMLAASPKGTVPVFICEDGAVIDESLDLALWALGQNDPRGWLTPDSAEGLALIGANDGDFKTHLDRYKYASRYDDSLPRGAVDLSHRAKACEHLDDLNARLSNSAFLFGDTPSLADIAIFPFIRQFAAVEPLWWSETPYSALRQWLSDWMKSDLFKRIMVKRPLWVDP